VTVIDDVPVRKVLGWTVAILSVLVSVALILGVGFLQAWAEAHWAAPSWLGWVVWPCLAAMIIFLATVFGIALFGSRGRAMRQERRERMRKLKNFDLEGG
jgi:hypothetical protein